MPCGNPPDIAIFHFVPLTHFRGAVRVVNSLLGNGHSAVLDLEDSLQCVFDAQRTTQLKESGRCGLQHFAAAVGRTLNRQQMRRIHVRINGIRTEHYEADMETLGNCYSLGFRPGIVLPKTESPDDLEKCAGDLKRRSGAYPQINSILETRQGLATLPDILAYQRSAWDGESDAVAFFGYFDYALDAGHWPLLSQFQHDFWNLSLSVRDQVEKAGLMYVHPPLQDVGGDGGLQRIKSMLLASGSKPPGMCSLGMQQTEALQRDIAPALMAFDAPHGSRSEALDHARWVIEQFEAARCNRRSFAVSDGYFISPHEYLLARHHLHSQSSPP